jgi:hypothetical protein
LARVAVPLGVVTVTFFSPTVPAGTVAVTVRSSTTATLVAATPPMATAVAPVRVVPLSVIVMPPEMSDDGGSTAASVGAGFIDRATRTPV